MLNRQYSIVIFVMGRTHFGFIKTGLNVMRAGVWVEQRHSFVILVGQNLKMRNYQRDHPNEDPVYILPDGRFNHVQQVNERLKFLRYVLFAVLFRFIDEFL